MLTALLSAAQALRLADTLSGFMFFFSLFGVGRPPHILPICPLSPPTPIAQAHLSATNMVFFTILAAVAVGLYAKNAAEST